MRDRHNAVRCDEGSLHDVHVLSANGVVQPEQVMVVARNFHRIDFVHGTSALMCNVVDHKNAPGVCQLVVVSVMHLQVSRLIVSLKNDSNIAVMMFLITKTMQECHAHKRLLGI